MSCMLPFKSCQYRPGLSLRQGLWHFASVCCADVQCNFHGRHFVSYSRLLIAT
jgi:hypothetical protein